MSPLVHRSAHSGTTMFGPRVVVMCLLQIKHVCNSLWHAVDPGLCMANLLELAIRTVSMARPGLMTRGLWCRVAWARSGCSTADIFRERAVEPCLPFFSEVGEAGCAKSHVEACQRSTSCALGSARQQFCRATACAQRMAAKVMTPANLLHRCAQHEAPA